MGEDVLSPVHAWEIYDQWRADSRAVFLLEPADFSQFWSRLGRQIAGGPNAWTDAYLAAFAAHSEITVVTLDRKFASLGAANVKCLL